MKDINNPLPERKALRLPGFDYSRKAAYFLTICTKNRAHLLSHILPVGTGVLDCPQVELTVQGSVAEKYLKQLGEFYDNLYIDRYVIMPNHIHLILVISAENPTYTGGQSGTPVPTEGTAEVGGRAPRGAKAANSVLSRFVSTFKRFCNKELLSDIWQPRFYDHIIRDAEDYEEHAKYIYENPLRWTKDELYSE